MITRRSPSSALLRRAISRWRSIIDENTTAADRLKTIPASE
jgi:hypothetical protein